MTYTYAGDSTLNLLIRTTDLPKADNAFLQQLVGANPYPLMVLFYPEGTGIPYPAWYGELSKSNLKNLKDSPARRTIAKRLLKGETAVFLFLACGEPETDEHFFNLLLDNLNKLKETLKIPTSGVDIDGNPIVISDYDNTPLSLSALKISRTDPAEKIFISQLLGTESDLAGFRTPMVFPVFGQGRSLYALVGNGINQKTLQKSCNSLVAWCSCEIKALHQGVDLLFMTDWSKRSGGTWIKDEPPPLTGLSAFIPLMQTQHKSDTIVSNDQKEKTAVPDTQHIVTEQISHKSPVVPDHLQNEDEHPASVPETALMTVLIIFVGVIILSSIVKIRSRREHQ